MTDRIVGTALQRWLCTGIVAAVPFAVTADAIKSKSVTAPAMQSAIDAKYHGKTLTGKQDDVNRLTTNRVPSWYTVPGGSGLRGGCVTCQPGDTLENESDCGIPVDSVNGGCNSVPIVSQSIVCDQTYCGTFAFDGATRDTDWFDFTVPGAPGTQVDVTLVANAEAPYVFGFTSTACTGFFDTFFVGDTCLEGSVTKCIPAGTTVYIVMLPQFVNTIACGDTLNGDWRMTVTCAPGSCPPPANDNCADADSISIPSTTIGSTFQANGDPEATTCGTDISAPGVWYKVTGNGNQLRLSTCSFNTSYDTKLNVYCGTCQDGLACVTGIDDDPNCASDIFQSTVEWCSAPGVEYHILVQGFGGATGDFELSLTDMGSCGTPVTCSPPANDECSAATLITCGSSGVYSNSFATSDVNDPVYSCSFGGPSVGANTVWFRFVATDVSAVVSLCPQLFPGLADSIIGIYSGTCGSLTEITCNDDDCGLMSEVCASGLTVGETYYVQVSSWIDSGSQGEFNLTVTCPCPPAPANDQCNNAQPILCGQTLSGTNVNADTDGFATCGAAGADVWYSFVAASSSVTISTCGSPMDTVLAVYDGPCGTQLACLDDFCGLQTELTVSGLTIGNTYYFNVSGFGAQEGTFDVTLTNCAPTGACCTGTACVETTEAACTGGGGVYLGDGTDCGDAGYVVTRGNAAMEDISGTGALGCIGDDCSSLVSLGFTFNYFGVSQTDINVGSNGHLRFGFPATVFGNPIALPTADGYDDVIAPYWDDWRTDVAPAALYTETRGSAPNRRFIAQWTEVAAFSNNALKGNFQAILYEADGTIEYRYGSPLDLISPVVGIENVDGSQGVNVTPLPVSGEFVRISPEAGSNPCDGDSCPNPGCVDPGADCDFNGDCRVDLTDLAILLANFGTSSGATNAQGDTNGDGNVDLADLSRVLSRFGNNCN